MKREVAAGLAGALLVIVAIGLLSHRPDPDEAFERRFPDFISANVETIRKLSKRPKSDARDKAMQAARENLQWAERYKRGHIDSDAVAETNEVHPESYAGTAGETPSDPEYLPPMRSSVYGDGSGANTRSQYAQGRMGR